MTELSPLEQLIFSLDQAEKRYFSLYAQRHALGGKNIYFKLFEAIAGSRKDKESSLGHIVPDQQLASHKHYLYQMILKAMRGYQGGKGTEVELREMIQDVGFLEGKRLFDPAYKLLKKAKRLAEHYERFTEWLQLLDIERRMVKLVPREKLVLDLTQIEEERKKVIQRLDVQYTYIELYDKLFLRLRQQLHIHKAEEVEELKQLLQTPLLADSSIPQSFHALSYFYLCGAYCQQLIGNFEAAHSLYAQNIRHWEQHPHWIENEPYQYQRALSNYAASCLMIDQMNLLPPILEKLKSYSGRTPKEKTEHFLHYYSYALTYLLNQWKLDEAKEMAREIELGLQKYGTRIPDSRRINFLYNLCVLSFLREEPKEGIKWLNKILHGERSEARQDLQRAARLFLLIFHYQLGNLDLYEHLFGTVRRYLGHLGINGFEEQVLGFLQGLYLQGDGVWPKAEAERVCAELEALARAYSDTHFLGIREVILWLRGRCEGVPLVEVARRGG